MTERFAIFGHPVAHSLSPVLHAANFASLGIDAAYAKMDVPPENLAGALAAAVADGCRGLNITVPHKQAIMPLLSRIAPSAVRAGAVNVVEFLPGGRTVGHNTDVDGFFADLDAHGISVSGSRVALAGCGGAGSALARGFAERGIASLAILNRSPGRAAALARELSAAGADVSACPFPPSAPEAAETVRAADIAVNATVVGLKPDDPSAFAPGSFRPGQTVYDIVPVAHETATCRAARAAGAAAIDGRGMLLRQAALAFRIWTGRDADIDAMSAALARAGLSG